MSTSLNGTYTPESAMVIVAHPDDIEFSCAGTIARWVRDGAKVSYVLLTSGQVGIKDAHITGKEAAAIREREQVAAAKVVGVDNVIFLGYQDGMLENTLEVRKKLVREIRKFRPEVVMTADPRRLFTPTNTYINHPDHRAAGAAALDAVFPAAGMPTLYKELEAEGLTAHETRKVYVMAWEESDTFVNISETIDLKLEALRQHKSQMGEWNPESMLRERAAALAAGKEMAYAETYRVIHLRTDEEWERCKGHVIPEDCPNNDD